jgi:hypothetical protein
MKKLSVIGVLLLVLFTASCVAPMPVTSSVDGTSPSNQGNARNWVMVMHGEACGSANEVASNMYVENNHETSIITAVVDISWTENGQAMHENRTLTVQPNSKTLIGCDHRNGIYLRMEIVNAQFN